MSSVDSRSSVDEDDTPSLVEKRSRENFRDAILALTDRIATGAFLSGYCVGVITGSCVTAAIIFWRKL